MKLVVFDTQKYDRESLSKHLPKGVHVEFVTHRLILDNVGRAKGANAICTFVNCDVNAEIINKLAEYGVSLILQRSAGYNNIDLDAASKNNIKVYRVPAYSPEGVAEFAMTLLMAINRNIHISYNRTKNKDFRLDGLQGDTIHGRTIGVLGSGKIGQCFIKIAKGLGAKVIVHDEYCEKNLPQLATEFGFEFVDKKTLFAQSHFLSLHAPLSEQTRYIVNKENLSLSQKGLIIINTSRGELINTSELLEFLDSGHVRGAGLDVYENEKGVFFYDHSNDLIPDLNLTRLRAHRNVILTSHQAFFTNQALEQIALTTMNNLNDFMKNDFSKALYKDANGKVING